MNDKTATTATNWREMDAGLEIDRLIAEQLGWTEIEENEYWIEDEYDSCPRKRLDGEQPNYGSSIVPLYTTDLNAALYFADVVGAPVQVVRDAHRAGNFEVYCPTPGGDDFIQEDGALNTAAYRVCRVVLAWQEAQG